MVKTKMEHNKNQRKQIPGTNITGQKTLDMENIKKAKTTKQQRKLSTT